MDFVVYGKTDARRNIDCHTGKTVQAIPGFLVGTIKKYISASRIPNRKFGEILCDRTACSIMDIN